MLPTGEPRRLAVRITPDALRQVRSGHPWVYDRSVVSAPADASTGDLAVIFDQRRRFAAIGLYDAESPIRIRVLHHGRPRPIDDQFWDQQVAASVERRAALAADPETTGYRCVHGENDALPGLVVDRYGEVAVVKLDTASLLPHLDSIVLAVERALQASTVVLRLSRSVAPDARFPGDGDVVLGSEVPQPVWFREHGLWFEADVIEGQKTGFFLDQRDNRRRVAGLADGCLVLDVFSASGGFSVAAAAGGARSVTSVDRSRGALAAAVRNMAANSARRPVAACDHRVIPGDAFEVLADLGRAESVFDLVVIDPPSFASNRASVDSALAAYQRLTGLGLAVLADGGVLIQASCSSRVGSTEFVRAVNAAAAQAGYDLVDVAQWGQPLDHPIGFADGSYLKAIRARAILRS